MIRIASSEVAINTDKRVPTEIIPPAYKSDAMTENPHWGIHPNKAPTMGPAVPTLVSAFAVKSLE